MGVAVFQDVVAGTPQTSTKTGFANSITLPSITPNTPYNLTVVSLGEYLAGTIYSIDSGFTIVRFLLFNSGVNFGFALAYKYQTTAAPVSPTWTDNNGPNQLASSMAVFPMSAPAASISGTGVLGFAGVSFGGGGVRNETGSGGLALAGISFNAAGARKETATANIALQGISFNSVGAITHIKGTGTMAFQGVSITASGFDAGVPGGLRQFWTC
jgi:hypothetical protein